MSETMNGKPTIRTIFRRSASLRYGAMGIVVIALIIALGPLLHAADPLAMDYAQILVGPNDEAPFGTDELGRDLLARVLYGGRTSMWVGLQVAMWTTVFGAFIGLVSGYFPTIDGITMRFMDIMMSFPTLLLAIVIMAAMGHNPLGVVIALTVVYTPRTARVVRASVLAMREEVYVEAARAVGVPTVRLLVRHIFPGVVPSLIVQETFIFAYAVLGEAGLSFVGVGIQPPIPSWGNILSDARVLMGTAPWMLVFPALAIMLTVLALNLLGDGLREALDPRRRGRGGGLGV